MPEQFLGGKVELHCGDSREVLKSLPDNSIDSIVCDPPYALVSIVKRFGANGAAPVKVPEGGSGAYTRASAGFMGKAWDTGETAFAVEFWAECLRVLKPGGHVVAFSGTRTYHRMACAIEDAGFEIRDMVSWIYGSGFPKSHNVGKGIDRVRDDSTDGSRVGVWLKAQREARGLKQKDVAALWPSASGGLTGCVANWETLGKVPKWDQWLQLKEAIGFGDDMDAEVWRLNRRKGQPGEAWQTAELIGIDRRMNEPSGIVNIGQGKRAEIERQIKAPNSSEAAQWQGWGTALKPSCEPICLARKPLIGTVAANVLEHGTGAINIDGCRISGDPWQAHSATGLGSVKFFSEGDTPIIEKAPHNLGRWPANIIHDGSEEVIAAFPEAGGQQGPVTGFEPSSKTNAVYGKFNGRPATEPRNDSRSAARFFYTAKADADDRLGSKHPTVKPVDLMQWLVRLVTPKGGTCLDPFAGTGTTAEAAFREGMRCILIERENEYQADIRRRMALVMAGPDERARESIKAKTKDQPLDLGPLFSCAQD